MAATLATAPDGDIAFLLGEDDDIAVHAPATFPVKGTIDLVTGRIGLDGTMRWYRQFGAPGGLVDDHSPFKTFGLQPDGKAIVAFRAAGQPVDFGSGPLAPTSTDLARCSSRPDAPSFPGPARKHAGQGTSTATPRSSSQGPICQRESSSSRVCQFV
ncbi:MAG: hypothetical protein JNL21_25885 [Myxococcales bacterium]|nr:hypothetical protein [Myxococcales bacterium]